MKIDVQESEWPELLPFLFTCVQGSQTRQTESALRIISDLAGFIMPVLLPQVNVLREQLARCMMHPETHVKIAGLSATTSFIRELDEDSDRNKFQDLIPVMLQTVSNILSTEEQDSAEESLEAFIEIAETHPKFLRRHLDVIVNNMLQVHSTHCCCDLGLHSMGLGIAVCVSRVSVCVRHVTCGMSKLSKLTCLLPAHTQPYALPKSCKLQKHNRQCCVLCAKDKA